MVQFSPLVLNLLAFKVNSMDNSSVVNAGAYLMIDQVVSYKRNQNVSEINGDLSPVYIPISSIIDPDGSDSNTIKNSVL